MGKEYTLCRIVSIRIAVSAVKDYSLGWSSVGLVVGLRRKYLKVEHGYFRRIIIVATGVTISIFDDMIIFVN